ncbi:MAG TPA: redox-sensing transcriptional repressor Rex [Spirochaetota bacterium]|nr:redox-sensing transcriptional repressor Rex [Spirochaetota bacterium]
MAQNNQDGRRMGKKGIPEIVIERLPRYYRCFRALRGKREKISSQELAAEMHTSASQIRLDLSHFGGFGLQGYGYNVEELHARLGEILGVDQTQYYVIAGAGRLGRAIANFPVFQEVGFTLAGIFDIDDAVIGQDIGGVRVSPVEGLAAFLAEHPVRIGIITTPAEAAPGVADVFRAAGVGGILNFAPVDIAPTGNMPVTNIHLTDRLLSLSWRIMNRERGQDDTR